MNNHHWTVLSMLPPWVGTYVGHISDSLTLQNVATIASIAYCVVGVFVMLKKNK